MIDIMKIIREERRRQGLSQEKLAYLAQVNKTSVHFWETYKFIPKFDLVINMLDALGLEIIVQRKDYCSTCEYKKRTDRKTEPTTEDCSTVPTSSKMEQVDEPQRDCGDFANRLAYERGVKHAWGVAQRVFGSTVTFYEAEDVAKEIDKDINVRSKDEPQTDCAWK